MLDGIKKQWTVCCLMKAQCPLDSHNDEQLAKLYVTVLTWQVWLSESMCRLQASVQYAQCSLAIQAVHNVKS